MTIVMSKTPYELNELAAVLVRGQWQSTNDLTINGTVQSHGAFPAAIVITPAFILIALTDANQQ
jgi:hypothetical protein